MSVIFDMQIHRRYEFHIKPEQCTVYGEKFNYQKCIHRPFAFITPRYDPWFCEVQLIRRLFTFALDDICGSVNYPESNNVLFERFQATSDSGSWDAPFIIFCVMRYVSYAITVQLFSAVKSSIWLG